VNKKKAYRKYLQDKPATTEKDYHQKRNIAKTQQESWENFISNIEHDIHGRQSFAYKIIKLL
jgi:hypothetical protein